MSGTVRTALKEWAAVTSALRAGDQTVLVRKGGIAEKRFDVPAERFVLFPTSYHQPENQFRAEFAHHAGEKGMSEVPDTVTVDTWAEVLRVHRASDLATLLKLAPHVIFTTDTIRDRFVFRPRQAMHVIVVRAWRLPRPVVVPVSPAHAGCRSWVEIEPSIGVEGSSPVLDDDAINLRLETLDQLFEG